MNLGYVRRWGWLVGTTERQSKEVALKWFEDEVMGTTKGLYNSISTADFDHYSTAWIAKVFAKADQSGSRFWIPDRSLPVE